MKKNKRGEGEFMHIVAAILAIVVLVVIIVIFTKNIGKENKTVSGQIDETSTDKDCDGVKNIVDRCCCTPADARDSVNPIGCGPMPPDSFQSCDKCQSSC